jgi:hypothetical protein
MQARSIVLGCTSAAALALAGALTGAQAATPKPLGYSYASCASKTKPCPFAGSTDAKSTRMSVNGGAVCTTGQYALSQLGYVKLKNGKATVKKTFPNVATSAGGSVSVKVAVKIALKVGKRATGSITITTSAKDCASKNGRVQKFSMKYRGPIYGG